MATLPGVWRDYDRQAWVMRTTSGVTEVNPGDWIITYDTGARSVIAGSNEEDQLGASVAGSTPRAIGLLQRALDVIWPEDCVSRATRTKLVSDIEQFLDSIE